MPEAGKPQIEAARFTAYRHYPHDQSRSGHVRGLTREEATDESRFPLGPQKDAVGRLFIWAYGLNDGNLI